MTGYYNTFVVKIWCEEAGGTIRGYIQHVSSQEHIHFLNLEDMTNFILSHLEPPPGESGTPDKTQGSWALLVEDFGDVS
jgi:hypothetical protein